MKMPPFIVIALAVATVSLTFGQSAQNEPTRQEIAEAYRSKSGEGGIFIPAVRWERWRIRDVRGWSLHFKRVKESRNIGVLRLEYRVFARKAGSCAEYRVTDTMPIPGNVQIQPGRRSRFCSRLPMKCLEEPLECLPQKDGLVVLTTLDSPSGFLLDGVINPFVVLFG